MSARLQGFWLIDTRQLMSVRFADDTHFSQNGAKILI